MCGIFGYIGYRKNAPQVVFEGLKKLEYRGYDSWGVGVVPDGKVKSIVTKKRVGKIGNSSVDSLPEGTLAFGHTRWATHGGVTEANAHPQMDCKNEVAVIHNGIFENYDEFKNELIKKGHKFLSQTDTETVAHLIEDYLKKHTFFDAVRMVFNKMQGLNALIAISIKERALVAARNGSPLVIGFGEGENFLASDAWALISYTDEIYFLEDNEIALLQDNMVKVFDAKTGKVKRIKKVKLKLNEEISGKGKYSTFMLKEIYEQPKVILEIATSGFDESRQVARMIKKARGVYLVGCGTASYACLAGTYFFSKIAGRHLNWAIGSEFGYHLNFLNKDSLVVAISQSGETMDILESVKKAQKKGAKIISLVNVQGSSLYRLSDYKILIGSGPEKAVASTKAFTGMLAQLIKLAYVLDGRQDEGRKLLVKSVHSLKELLSSKNVKKIRDLSLKLRDKKHIYVIGRGLSYPTSLEAALKIKEISYIHAEGIAAGELKHGPLALVEKGTPCIAFLPNDETYGATLAGAMEMRARGGYVIGISFKPHEVFDYYIHIEDAGEATIIPNVVVAQLLAYFLTVRKGLDPDMPRNLAKSVTVK